MKKFIEKIINCMDSGLDSVLCTVVASSGSTPRGAGARMLVTEAGRVAGTIGGGAVEYRAMKLAAEILITKRSYEKAFCLNRSDVEDLGMICGGNVRVFFQFISAGDDRTRAVMLRCLNEMEKGGNVWLVTDITDEAAWSAGTIYDGGITGLDIPADALKKLTSGRAVRVAFNGREYYSEPVSRAGRVIIFGGGHVAQELVPVISHVGFNCIVIDDRPEFASAGLFPTAERVIVGDFTRIKDYIDISNDDYVVVITRGHSHDYIVEEQVLKMNVGYIGAIGSRQKIAAVSQKLRDAGISQQAIDSVYSPIGVDIKAETPAEIAVSIAGELIRVRAERMEDI